RQDGTLFCCFSFSLHSRSSSLVGRFDSVGFDRIPIPNPNQCLNVRDREITHGFRTVTPYIRQSSPTKQLQFLRAYLVKQDQRTQTLGFPMAANMRNRRARTTVDGLAAVDNLDLQIEDIAARFKEFSESVKAALSIEQVGEFLEANGQDLSGSDDALLRRWMFPLSKLSKPVLVLLYLVTPRLDELQLFRSQLESKLTEEGENSSKKNVRDKRKQVSEIPDEHYPAKRQKDAAQKPKKAHGKDSDVLNPGEQTVEKSKPKGHKPDIQNEQRMEERVPEEGALHLYQILTLRQANDEHVRQFFSDVGGVVA
ncbi:PREDICTED: squamous cell carcinoma antigen recognized by T-cells 3, partial [Prunus dulcis]